MHNQTLVRGNRGTYLLLTVDTLTVRRSKTTRDDVATTRDRQP